MVTCRLPVPFGASCCNLLSLHLPFTSKIKSKHNLLVQLQSRGLRSRSNRTTAEVAAAGPSVQHSPTPPSRRQQVTTTGLNQEVLLQARLYIVVIVANLH